MKTLHIHIGTPKTATTAIQNFCMENTKALEARGYCYPLFPYVYEKTAPGRNGHFLIGTVTDRHGKRSEQAEKERFAEAMQNIRKLFVSFDHVILSEEDIWRLMDDTKKDIWENLKKEAKEGGFGIHAVVYLRRQDKYFVSNWNQNIKQLIGTYAESTYEEFFQKANKKTRLEYYSKLAKAADLLGKENITVRRFDKGQFEGGSIYADFLSAVGLELTDEYEITQGVRNVGLYGNTHEIKRVLNSITKTADENSERFLREMLLEYSELSGSRYPSEMMSKEETEAFLENYKPDNRKIAEEYLHEPGADLFDYTVKDIPKWQKDNPFLYDDIICLAGTAFMALYKESREIRQEVNVLKSFVFHLRHPVRSLIGRIKRGRGV